MHVVNGNLLNGRNHWNGENRQKTSKTYKTKSAQTTKNMLKQQRKVI